MRDFVLVSVHTEQIGDVICLSPQENIPNSREKKIYFAQLDSVLLLSHTNTHIRMHQHTHGIHMAVDAFNRHGRDIPDPYVGSSATET